MVLGFGSRTRADFYRAGGFLSSVVALDLAALYGLHIWRAFAAVGADARAAYAPDLLLAQSAHDAALLLLIPAFIALARFLFAAAKRRADSVRARRRLAAATDWYFAAAVGGFVIRPNILMWMSGESGFTADMSNVGAAAFVAGLAALICGEVLRARSVRIAPEAAE